MRQKILITLILLPFFAFANLVINGIEYAVVGSTELEVVDTDGYYQTVNKDHLEIPAHIDYIGIDFKVTRLGSNILRNDYSFKTIFIPQTVSYIDPKFSKESNVLEYIYVDDNNPNFCSLDGVLYSKDCKTLIRYPSEKVGEEYEIPQGVNRIESYAFLYTDRLSSVKIPSSVKEIGAWAFMDCHIKSIKLPDLIKILEPGTFHSCDRLEVVELPADLTYIGHYSFMWCTSLKELVIPKKVEFIGGGCFYDDDNLREFTCLAETPPALVGEEESMPTFWSFSYLVNKVYVPSESMELYQNTPGWNTFNFCPLENATVDQLPSEDIKLIVNNGSLRVNGCSLMDKVKIYSSNGLLVYSGKCDGIPFLSRGLYIVVIKNKSFKVVL